VLRSLLSCWQPARKNKKQALPLSIRRHAPGASGQCCNAPEQKAKPAACAPKADKSVPFSSYQKLTDGKQLMFAYYAASTAPVEYEKVAAILEPQKYVYEQDEFKRRDVLAALKPQIDAAVEKAKQSKYYKIAVGSSSDLDKYDFESKSFLCKSLPYGRNPVLHRRYKRIPVHI
jgi:hypothetical protein